jgi:hypothetical protein
VPHNATPVLDDGGKMASPAEVGHWRLKGSKTPLGASRIEPCQLSGQQLRRYFGLGLGALMQRAPARGRGAGARCCEPPGSQTRITPKLWRLPGRPDVRSQARFRLDAGTMQRISHPFGAVWENDKRARVKKRQR